MSAIHFLVMFSGLAALSWEVIWQIKSSLALGVSAWGTAVTLSITMGGMSAGALLAGRLLKSRQTVRPIRIYAVLELVIGAAGLALAPAFQFIEGMDSAIFASNPDGTSQLHILGIVAVLGLPAICMGATLPALGLASRQFNTSIALLYGLNTLGAAVGTLMAGLYLIPTFGVSNTILIVSAINVIVALLAWFVDRGGVVPEEGTRKIGTAVRTLSERQEVMLAMVTGFATFMLEVAWFRSLTATFMSTTDAFSLMLASVLLALGVGAAYAPRLKQQGRITPGQLLLYSGTLILFITPIIERFDITVLLVLRQTDSSAFVFLQWFLMTLCTIGAPILLLGIVLPWLLDDQNSPRRWGLLYGLNAFSAIVGSVLAAWVFLPNIGFARTAWLTGSLVACAGLLVMPKGKRALLSGLAALALVTAVYLEAGVGRKRVQGRFNYRKGFALERILKTYEGPEATVSVIEYNKDNRGLIIDGVMASSQTSKEISRKVEHYMPWMGHLPMILHPDPKDALVICFGTGQTANSVRNERASLVDIVDINKNVFKLAPYFPRNENVLEDPKVHQIVMDGRAFIRRTQKIYDVITLEPMPPNFAGVNALYSKEFYLYAREKLGKHGTIAQWMPFHLIPPYYSASIVRTFQSVFPNSVLWIDPHSTTGIILGSKNDSGNLAEEDWPGLSRTGIPRDLSAEVVREQLFLGPDEMKRYGELGEIITDDNQLLAYGKAAQLLYGADFSRENYELLNTLADEPYPMEKLGLPPQDE